MTKTTVLIVDHDPVSLVLLSKLVEKLDYHVTQAKSGAHALKVLQDEAVDLVVADHDMPSMNGLELLKMVKAEFPRLPYILVTAHSNLKLIREAWESGAFDFFQKPVFVDRLNQTIRLGVEFGHLTIARRKLPQLEMLNPHHDLLDIGVVRELALAINRADLTLIVEEFEAHARIELEHLLRFAAAKDFPQVRSVAHRLAGTSINLGLVKLPKDLRWIEDHPDLPVKNPTALAKTLEESIHWLNHLLVQIFQDLAG